MKKLRCLLPGLGVLLLAGSPARAQSPTPPATSDDSLKGRVWTATARRIWVDTRLRVPLPAPWPTNAAFTKWLAQASAKENGGLGLLRGDVIKRLNGQAAPAPQLAQAILAEVRQPRQQWLSQVNAATLQADLQKLTPLPPAPATAAPAATAPATPAPTADTTRPLAQVSPDSSLATAPVVPLAAPAPRSFFEQHPGLAGLLGFVLGMALTLGIRWALRPRRPTGRHSSAHSHHHSSSAMQLVPEDNSTITQLRDEIQRLTKYVKELEAKLLHYENANAADTALTTDDAPEPALAAPVAPAELAESAAPAAATLRYGPVQETAFLEDRKIVEVPLPQLALQLILNPDAPERATFTLSPHVNQSMLIGDGLNRLQQFFDYDPPVGRISAVAATAPGTLQRQPGGWQVVARGQLAVR